MKDFRDYKIVKQKNRTIILNKEGQIEYNFESKNWDIHQLTILIQSMTDKFNQGYKTGRVDKAREIKSALEEK